MPAPPRALIDSLVTGPSVLAGLEWYDETDSTNARAAAAGAAGAPEVHAVLADMQTAGRGRHGRAWDAPPGTSLLLSLLVRPAVDPKARPLLSLVTGLALAEAVAPFVPPSEVSLKWPNDLLVDGRKAAGILAEVAGDAHVVGVGLNVDWRGVQRPAALADATSLAEAAGAAIDRWRVLAALIGVFGNRYRAWCRQPRAFLPAYRARCGTLGRAVRVRQLTGEVLDGTAVDVTDDGHLEVLDAGGRRRRVQAGDVEHVRRGT